MSLTDAILNREAEWRRCGQITGFTPWVKAQEIRARYATAATAVDMRVVQLVKAEQTITAWREGAARDERVPTLDQYDDLVDTIHTLLKEALT